MDRLELDEKVEVICHGIAGVIRDCSRRHFTRSER